MQVSVDEMLNSESTQTTNTKTEFFSLVNDGDSAIVRFLHTDINDFEVLDVHNIPLGGFNRKINCLRLPNGSKDECPICLANTFDEEKGSYTYPLQRKFYIHMLKYDNPQTAKELVWERSKDYIKKLNELEQNYGPLYGRLYKIVRHGAKGSTDTTYDILPLDKDRFVPDNYVFNTNQLNYRKALGTTVLNKNAEEISEYLSTGNFPGFRGSNTTPRPEVKSVVTTNTNIQESVQSNQVSGQPRVVNTYSYDEAQVNDNNSTFSFDGPRRRV